jgi:hypothetical protein
MDITATRWRTRRQRRPVRRAAQAVAALIALGVLATACSQSSSGPGVASAGSSTPSGQSSSSSNPHASLLAYARCMRSQGISDFPDPDSQGAFRVSGDVRRGPRFQAADNACKALLPPRQPPQQRQAQLLNLARCMRARGITNFPDPTPDTPFSLHGLDPNSPQFKAAENACKQYLVPGDLFGKPGSGGGS